MISPTMPTYRGHILIVDDNRVNRLMLSRILEEQGHTFATAENGFQALELLRASNAEGSPAFDIVLLDILMPVMDGYETLSEIKKDPALQHLPVIMISALDEMESVIRCIEMGARDYLPKPFEPALLNARLNASLVSKRLRDLERAYLQQEVMLRQSEKLATLGKFSAGMAHELNNPAAAARRSSKQLAPALQILQEAHLAIISMELSSDQISALRALEVLVQEKAIHPKLINALQRSDLESTLEIWLEAHGLEEPWAYTSSLVNMDLTPAKLEDHLSGFDDQNLPVAIAWLDAAYTIYALVEEIVQGTSRISEIISTLKAYTYMDQAPVQAVDVNESLDNTLAVLADRLQEGVTVRRDYIGDIPRIQAYGSELNQVWTNIINNAVDALGNTGEIILRSRHANGWVTVEIEDNGPGIPPDIQPRIFDPFFTTKPPGHGTGLGLNIAHTIVVQRHNGKIVVHSNPGKTRFEVSLPVNGL